jgi:hypothetical protein
LDQVLEVVFLVLADNGPLAAAVRDLLVVSFLFLYPS